MLPKTLSDALTLFEREPLFREQFGKTFVDYYVKIKRTELQRYESYVKDHGIDCSERGDDSSGSRTSISIFSDDATG